MIDYHYLHKYITQKVKLVGNNEFNDRLESWGFQGDILTLFL